jgi:hypothetical protein
MRLYELQRKKKKEQAPFDPVEDARQSLEWEKESGSKALPNGTLQLFVPRKIERYNTKKEREEHILRDRAKYAYDDEGNMIPQYSDWVNSATESIIREGAPVIAGGWLPTQGGDKPLNAVIWTSTGKKLPNGKWTSDWNRFIQGRNASGEPGKIGYIYEVLPNTAVLELDSIHDATNIYKIFATLGRSNTTYADPKEWEENKKYPSLYGGDDEGIARILRKDFPWQEIAKHFDCVHHWAMGRNYSGYGRDPFFESYDVESTVWFKPNQLELLGQVNLWTENDRENDEDY